MMEVFSSSFPLLVSHNKILLESTSVPPQQKVAVDKFGGGLVCSHRYLTPQLSWAASVSSRQ